ncbi:hypothetical protein EI94DRAFT_1701869 [Lactarius quietus]|nr:hypothetical protein EI94DRAFT_1701869 [Lactarius quietus]
MTTGTVVIVLLLLLRVSGSGRCCEAAQGVGRPPHATKLGMRLRRNRLNVRRKSRKARTSARGRRNTKFEGEGRTTISPEIWGAKLQGEIRKISTLQGQDELGILALHADVRTEVNSVM